MTSITLISLLFVAGWTPHVPVASDPSTSEVCVSDGPPVYYAIDLVSTKHLPGTRLAFGKVELTFHYSPFGVAVNSAGRYQYDLSGSIQGLKPPKEGVYVVWLSTPDLSQVRPIGPLDPSGSFSGLADWQKFLVIVTLESSFDPAQTHWKGPVALRGLSRSGKMHTMAGHGPFQTEPCAFFGYK